MKENKKKDKWDKAKILGSVSTAVILAFAAIMGSIFVPDWINQQSLESQKIIQLSELVPHIYDSSAALRPSVIAMASYGAPAVSFLLLVIDDAIQSENDTTISVIVSTMKYMDNDSKEEIRAKLEMEIEQLDQRNLEPHNLTYIGHIVSILDWPRLDKKSLQMLEDYFSKVSKFTVNRYKLQELNGTVLRALSDNGFNISRLQLQGVDFEGQDLREIDFTNADLKNTILIESELDDCKFAGAILDSCDLSGAFFFAGYEDTLSILNTFKELAKSNWRKAKMDSTAYHILIKLDKDPQNTDLLRAMAGDIKEGF